MAPPYFLKQDLYDIGDVVFIGGHITESCRGRIASSRKDDRTYVILTEDMYIRIHESSILGRSLSIEERYDILEQENRTLRDIADDAKIAITHLNEEIKSLNKHLAIATNELQRLRFEVTVKAMRK